MCYQMWVLKEGGFNNNKLCASLSDAMTCICMYALEVTELMGLSKSLVNIYLHVSI